MQKHWLMSAGILLLYMSGLAGAKQSSKTIINRLTEPIVVEITTQGGVKAQRAVQPKKTETISYSEGIAKSFNLYKLQRMDGTVPVRGDVIFSVDSGVAATSEMYDKWLNTNKAFAILYDPSMKRIRGLAGNDIKQLQKVDPQTITPCGQSSHDVFTLCK